MFRDLELSYCDTWCLQKESSNKPNPEIGKIEHAIFDSIDVCFRHSFFQYYCSRRLKKGRLVKAGF